MGWGRGPVLGRPHRVLLCCTPKSHLSVCNRRWSVNSLLNRVSRTYLQDFCIFEEGYAELVSELNFLEQ